MPRARLAAALALLALAAGCAARAGTDPPVTVRVPGAEVIIGAPGVPVGTPAAALGIPEGHWPPPGSCRVWHPERPPGQQPPPGPCHVRVPAGAVLVRG